jgi:nicotinamidase-related amidase
MEPLPESPKSELPAPAPESVLEPAAAVVEVLETIVDKVEDLVPEPVKTVIASLVPELTSHLSKDQAALVKVITDLVTSKPKTKEEALELFHALQLQIGTWVVSELPPREGKAILMGLWAMEELQKCNVFSCFGKK